MTYATWDIEGEVYRVGQVSGDRAQYGGFMPAADIHRSMRRMLMGHIEKELFNETTR